MLGSDSCERCELRIEMRDRRGSGGLIRNYRKEEEKKGKFNTSQNKQLALFETTRCRRISQSAATNQTPDPRRDAAYNQSPDPAQSVRTRLSDSRFSPA